MHTPQKRWLHLMIWSALVESGGPNDSKHTSHVDVLATMSINGEEE